MNSEYKKELSNLKYKMKRAEMFAGKIPLFSEVILQRKLSGDEVWIKFGDNYKDLYCAHGIDRGLYETGLNRTVTNYEGEPYKCFLFNIYINTLSQYKSHERFGLEKIKETTPLFFYDCLNSTFYATDDQIEDLLDALSLWHKEAKVKIVEHNKKKEIAELKSKLGKLESI